MNGDRERGKKELTSSPVEMYLISMINSAV